MNIIVFSEYSFEEYLKFDNFDPLYTYVDARHLPKDEIETRWVHEKTTCFFLGTNGMPYLSISSPEQVWFYDGEHKYEYYCLSDFIDHEKFKIESSYDAYKHFRTGRFGGFRKWKWSDYMAKNVWKNETL